MLDIYEMGKKKRGGERERERETRAVRCNPY